MVLNEFGQELTKVNWIDDVRPVGCVGVLLGLLHPFVALLNGMQPLAVSIS